MLRPVREMLGAYSVREADAIFEKWTRLEEFLLVKFIDGNVKSQDENGEFITNGSGKNIPDKIVQPGYTETWKRVVDREHGDIVEMK